MTPASGDKHRHGPRREDHPRSAPARVCVRRAGMHLVRHLAPWRWNVQAKGKQLTTAEDRTTTRHPAQWLALVIGATYTLVGLIGFAITGFSGFAAPEGELLLGIFEINPLHNVVHLAIGLAGLALWKPLERARLYGWLLAAGYGLTFLYGLFVADSDEPANFLALNQGANWLHLFSTLAGLAIALWPARQAAQARTRTARS